MKKRSFCISFIVSLFFAGIFSGYTAYKNNEYLKVVTENYAVRAERTLERLIRATEDIDNIQSLINRELTYEEFKKIALIKDEEENYFILVYAPNAVVKYVYPEEDAITIGLDLFKSPITKELSLKAKETGKLSIVAPQTLLQGGDGILIRNPVFVTDEDGNKNFWGFVNALIKSKILSEMVGISSITPLDMDYRIEYHHNNKNTLLEQSNGFHEMLSYTNSFPLRDYTWSISTSMTFSTYFSIYTAAIFFLFCMSVSLILFMHRQKRQELYEKAQDELNSDPLTGIFNRRKIENTLVELVEKQNPFLVIYIDLNDFKPVNDNFGHDIGDKLLKIYSARLKYNISYDAIVGRMGGDEFIAIINGEFAQNEQEIIVERIRKLSSELFYIDNNNIYISASIGLADYPKESKNIDDLLSIADKRMYEDKKRIKGEK